MDLQPRPHESLDCILGGNIQLLQSKRGYRTAIDAPLLAWFAAREVPGARTVLELGAGSGLVSIVLARTLPQARVHLLEKQPEMAERSQRNACLNGVADRLDVQLGDVAEVALPRAHFDLVLCNPPYRQQQHGHAPGDRERHIAHQETTATLRQFCQAAASALAPTGQSCWVFPYHDRERLLVTLAESGLAAQAYVAVRHRPNDLNPNRILVRAGHGAPDCQELESRAIHLQDQPDRVFQPDIAQFFAALAPQPTT